MDGEGIQLSCTIHQEIYSCFRGFEKEIEHQSLIKALNIVFELDWQKSEVSSLKRKNMRFF